MICSTSPSSSRGVQSCFARTSSREAGGTRIDMRPMVESRGIDLAIQIAPDLPFVFVDARAGSGTCSPTSFPTPLHTRSRETKFSSRRTAERKRQVFGHRPRTWHPAEHQARLFERFFRMPGSDPRGAASVSPLQGNRGRARRTDRSQQFARSGSGVLFRSSCSQRRVLT